MREYSVFNKGKLETSYLKSLRGMFDFDKRLSIEETVQAEGYWEDEFFVIRAVTRKRAGHD